MSEYPSDWKVMALGEVAEVVGGGTPSRDTPAFWGDDHYWITPSEVVAIDGKMASHSKEKISNLGLASSGAKLHPPGTILMTSRASIGFAAIAVEDICTNQGFQSLRCGKALDNWFALHQIRHRRAELQQLAAGSTFLEVSGSNIRSFPFVIPPLPEQKKIAEILSGIDKLIIKKEKQICILENLEKSVLDALTDQELRAGTRCAPLSEIVSPGRKITYGIVQAGPNIKDGIPYIRVTDMSDEELDINKMLRTSPEIAEKFKRSEVQEGDIVVALRGIIGATHLIDDRTSGANLTQGTALLSKSDKCLPLYVNTILKSQFCREQFSLLSKGSTIVEITLSSLATLMIPLPNISTQERIANSIASIKRQISSNRKSLASIRSMKNAIASDLLSGRKRVSV
jgi:type I restriction enzyme S subunit